MGGAKIVTIGGEVMTWNSRWKSFSSLYIPTPGSVMRCSSQPVDVGGLAGGRACGGCSSKKQV